MNNKKKGTYLMNKYNKDCDNLLEAINDLKLELIEEKKGHLRYIDNGFKNSTIVILFGLMINLVVTIFAIYGLK